MPCVYVIFAIAISIGNSCNRCLDNCAQGLVCNEHEKCVPGISAGLSCDEEETFCEKGLFCAYTVVRDKGRKKIVGTCVPSFATGQSCITGSGNWISAPTGVILYDSCGAAYTVDKNFSLHRIDAGICSYNDACNGRSISAPKGGTLYDSCGSIYTVDMNCGLRRK